MKNQSEQNGQQIPKGHLLIIGGHEDKIFAGDYDSPLRESLRIPHFDVLGRLIDKIPHTHDTIEIIAAASSIPREMEETYVDAYKSAGYSHVRVMRLDDEAMANDPEMVQRINYAHAVFFTGGDQRKLTHLLNDTAVLAAIKKKYFTDSHFIIAGTSAGAMSLPEIIIERGVIEEAILKNDLIIGKGFGLIENVIVDTHFIKRGRFGRLAYAVALNKPSYTGFGLGEDGAMLVSNGNEAECIGSGMVVVIDGSGIGNTNADTAIEGVPIAIENLKVHILVEGCKYLIHERQFIYPDHTKA